jgi:YbbR domain-containing protein
MNKTAKKWIVRGILTIIAIVLAVVLYYMVAYTYLYTKAMFTWQCKIYTGEMTVEGREVCNRFNNGGLWEVLTK